MISLYSCLVSFASVFNIYYILVEISIASHRTITKTWNHIIDYLDDIEMKVIFNWLLKKEKCTEPAERVLALMWKVNKEQWIQSTQGFPSDCAHVPAAW